MFNFRSNFRHTETITVPCEIQIIRHNSRMRVLIVGAAGQDGSLLAEKYSEQGDVVLGVGSNLNRHKPYGFDMIYTDLANSDKSKSIFRSFKPDRIFHLAAVHSSSALAEASLERTHEKIHSCNVLITKNILDWQRSNSDCKSIIGLSSQMYSFEKSGKYIDESSIVDPRNYYAKTKVEALSLLRKYRSNYGTKSSGAILFNHTSKRSKPEFLFPQLALQIAESNLTTAKTSQSQEQYDAYILALVSFAITEAIRIVPDKNDSSSLILLQIADEAIR